MATIIIIWILNVHDGIDINRRKLRHKKHVAAQSTRLKILNTLIKRRCLLVISQELNIERKVITFHLNALEKAELVKSEFGLTEDKRPSAVKYYEITPKGKEIFENLFKILKKLDSG